MANDLTLDSLKASAPEGGFFAEREWLWSPRPFQLSKKERKFLGGLGHLLNRFQQSCDLLYRQSAAGKMTPWIAEVLDAGKSGRFDQRRSLNDLVLGTRSERRGHKL